MFRFILIGVLATLQVQSKPLFFLGKSPFMYTWGLPAAQFQPQLQPQLQPQYQPQLQPQYQQSSYVMSSPLIQGSSFQDSIVGPFRSLLQKQSLFHTGFPSSPQLYGRAEPQPSFAPTVPVPQYGTPSPIYGSPAPMYGPPSINSFAPQFAPTGPPASSYGPPSYQTSSFQTSNYQPQSYQPPNPFNQQPPPPNTFYGVPPSSVYGSIPYQPPSVNSIPQSPVAGYPTNVLPLSPRPIPGPSYLPPVSVPSFDSSTPGSTVVNDSEAKPNEESPQTASTRLSDPMEGSTTAIVATTPLTESSGGATSAAPTETPLNDETTSVSLDTRIADTSESSDTTNAPESSSDAEPSPSDESSPETSSQTESEAVADASPDTPSETSSDATISESDGENSEPVDATTTANDLDNAENEVNAE